MVKKILKAIITELWKCLSIALSQVLGTTTNKDLLFTPFAQYQMGEWGVSKADVRDAFYHGQPAKKKPHMRLRKYGDYFLCLTYDHTKEGNPRIRNVWKWDGKK